jgi:cytochrome oxidase Cu insertion factor (SCO1/SenC/PrrC family)
VRASKFVILLTVLAALGLTVSIAGMAIMASRGGVGAGPAAGNDAARREAFAGLSLGAFSLTDQDGAAIDASVLIGQYTLVDFIFTNCPLACPAMSDAMRRVQDETAGTRLRFLSISIDGENDTPEVLRAYAARVGANPGRWRFATGPREVVWPMVEGLGLQIEADESFSIPLAGGGSMQNILHTTRFVLIGPEGRVVDMFSSTNDAELARLIAFARGVSG